jgi:NAD+ synthase (glutamine-hydrolysing)
MVRVRLGLAQINATVGGVRENCACIVSRINEARTAGVHVVVFPELAVSGYPPEDLLLKPSFLEICGKSVEQIADACSGIVAIVGFPEKADDLYNSAAVICDGKIVGIYRKCYLPNYGVFDEDRYFKAGQQTSVYVFSGWTLGVSICEDIWYPAGPSEAQALDGGADLLVNISASPYHAGKARVRERMLATRATDNVAVVAFCNLVGGQDELVFDGGSVVYDSRGVLLARARQFEEDLVVADVQLEGIFRQRLLDPRRRKRGSVGRVASVLVERVPVPWSPPRPTNPLGGQHIAEPLGDLAEIYSALVLGTRDYVVKNGFQKVVVGLSGGVDSSLVACVAVDGLGAENVIGVSMPSRYSSDHSQNDAAGLAQLLGIRFLSIGIEPVFRSFLEVLEPAFSGLKPDLTEENLQARIRGAILMALSNKFGWLVLTTGNKSEMSVGYATLYGDMAGGFGVIKDVSKTQVYELAHYRNQVSTVIPENILVKPPSAELRTNQKDSDSLPEYSEMDPILAAYVEENWKLTEMVSVGFSSDTVREVIRLVDRAEYKRRQAPPGVKITPRAFGKDRRLPITNRFSEE